MSVTTVSSSMITDATILNADIGAAAAIATTKLGAGAIVQAVNVMNGAGATTTTQMPDDDTIPQKTEGGEFLTLAITPTHASNKLLIQVVAALSHSAAAFWMTIALFQDTTANALAATQYRGGAATEGQDMSFNHYMAAGTTSETTFKVRAGGGGGTVTFNGSGAARKMGGVYASSITITEIKV